MKNLIYSFVLCLGLVGVSFQSHGQAAIIALIFGDKVANESFYLRVDLGANFTTLPGLSGAESRTAFYYGLGTYIKINDRWSLAPEFKPLSPRGARNIPAIIDYSGTLTGVTYQANANYMDVPFLVTYTLPSHLFFSTGPQVSFKTSAKQLAEGTSNRGTKVDARENVYDTFASTIFSVPVEVGYTFAKARDGNTIQLRLRYNIGLSEMIADPSYGSSRESTFQAILSLPVKGY